MALSDFGNRDNDPGTFHTLGDDPETGKEIYFKIRALTDDMLADARKKVNKPKRKIDGQWKAEPLDDEDFKEIGWHTVYWMWTDSLDLFMRIEDDEALEIYNKELGGPPYKLQTKTKKGFGVKESSNALKKGDSVLVDGRLTDGLKRHLCERYGKFASFVIEVNNDLQTKFGEGEDRLQENLSTGSPSA